MSEIWHRHDEVPKHQDIIMTDTGCWAYRVDLFALETELERTRKALNVAVDVLRDTLNYDDVADMISEALEQIKQIIESPIKNVQTTYTADGTTRTFYGKKCKVEFDVPPETQTHISITETE